MSSTPPARAAFTYFHALWLSVAFGGALLGLGLPDPPTPIWLRLVAAAGGALAGLFLGGIAVAALVIWIVIPRLTPGSVWSKEVDCYMLSILGEKWQNAGRDVPPN